jgi:hypothetical protein
MLNKWVAPKHLIKEAIAATVRGISELNRADNVPDRQERIEHNFQIVDRLEKMLKENRAPS